MSMTPKQIASVVVEMEPKSIMNPESVWLWRLEKAAEMGAVSVMLNSISEFKTLKWR